MLDIITNSRRLQAAWEDLDFLEFGRLISEREELIAGLENELQELKEAHDKFVPPDRRFNRD